MGRRCRTRSLGSRSSARCGLACVCEQLGGGVWIGSRFQHQPETQHTVATPGECICSRGPKRFSGVSEASAPVFAHRAGAETSMRARRVRRGKRRRPSSLRRRQTRRADGILTLSRSFVRSSLTRPGPTWACPRGLGCHCDVYVVLWFFSCVWYGLCAVLLSPCCLAVLLCCFVLSNTVTLVKYRDFTNLLVMSRQLTFNERDTPPQSCS